VGCDDGLTCTDDSCDGSSGKPVCAFKLKPGFCRIDGVCYAANVVDPQDACRRCDPANNTAWSPVPPPCVSTFAGVAKSSGNKVGPVAQARFTNPHDVDVDAAGMVYVSDEYNRQVKRISNGLVSVLAGSGYGCAVGSGAGAMFTTPAQIHVDGGRVLFADDSCAAVWAVDLTSAAATVVAGIPGLSSSPPKDGYVATATLTQPMGVTAFGAKVLIADPASHSLRQVESGYVLTWAGSYSSPGCANGSTATATFKAPSALAAAANGTIYVADADCYAIRTISGGIVSQLAGTGSSGADDGPASTASFMGPKGIAVSADGARVYVADTTGNCIRLVEKGVVTTIAGSCGYDTNGFQNGPAAKAKFDGPFGLALLSPTKLLVADEFNHVIRLITLPP